MLHRDILKAYIRFESWDFRRRAFAVRVQVYLHISDTVDTSYNQLNQVRFRI